MADEKTVAITSISNDDVEGAVLEALELIGAEELMEEGMVVLLKPNMLSAKPPERAVTTHPAVLKAVINWVKKFNPKRIVVSDSSAGIKQDTTVKVAKASLIQETCEQEGAEFIPFEKTTREVFHVEDPFVLDEFPASTLLKDADIIINLPKIKTHGLTRITCSVKNMFGTLLLGHKPKTHASFPSIHDFSKALVDIYSVSRPQLTIVDGYYAMEGKGPSAGDVVRFNKIVAGKNGVMVDAVVCGLMDCDPHEIYHLKLCEEKGLGTIDLEQITVVGEKIKDVKRKWVVPRGRKFVSIPIPMPKFLSKFLAEKLFKAKIKFDEDACRLCGTCWNNCPVNAIAPPEDKEREKVPRWDGKKCIACYCCAETCPYEAIDFAMHPIRNAASTWEFWVILIAGIIALIFLVKLIRFLIT
ncbi:MAG: DUF362 domain-containing protein [Promethearchaeota archaeon]